MSTFLLILLTSSVGSISHIRLLWELRNLNDNACPCHTNGVQVDKNWLYMSEQPVPVQSLPYSMLKYRRKNQKKFRKNIELLSPTTPSQLSAIDFIDVLRKSCLNLCWISPLWCGLALFQCIAAFPFRTSGSKKSKTTFFFFFFFLEECEKGLPFVSWSYWPLLTCQMCWIAKKIFRTHLIYTCLCNADPPLFPCPWIKLYLISNYAVSSKLRIISLISLISREFMLKKKKFQLLNNFNSFSKEEWPK